MWLQLAGVVLGLGLLTVSAEHFVRGAVRVAASLRVSTVVIGAVVIGFGTSAPEIVVSALAAGQGKLDIAVGNIIGSNVANLSLVLGTSALVVGITVAGSTLRREAPLSLAATLLFAVLVQGGLVRWEGIVLLVALVATLAYILVASRRGDDTELAGEVDEMLTADGAEPSARREALRTLLGLLGTMAAAQVLVQSASGIAETVGLEEGFVGFTIVAIGTSLPELATSLQAARRNETDLIVGNLLGSNVFNSLAVGGTAALVGPGGVADQNLTGIGIGLMVTVSVVGTLFMRSGREVVRWEGALLLIAYVSTLPLLA